MNDDAWWMSPRNLLVKQLLLSKRALWDGAQIRLLHWWGKMPQTERQFMVDDAISWSYCISGAQVRLSMKEPWHAERTPTLMGTDGPLAPTAPKLDGHAWAMGSELPDWFPSQNWAQGQWSKLAIQKQNARSLTQLSLLQSNPRNRRNQHHFTDGYFPLEV